MLTAYILHTGNVYISDYNNHRIRKVLEATSDITTIAGTGSSSYSGDGGLAINADIYYPQGINLDVSDNVYFGDGYNVRKITVSTGVISIVAGTGSLSGGYNGDNIQATAALLNGAGDVVLDTDGNIYIADRYNHRIRKVEISTGIITTIVGTGSASSTGDGSYATSATVNNPNYSRFDTSGNYYITEAEGNRVRKVISLVTTQQPSYAPSMIPSSQPTNITNPPSSLPTYVSGSYIISTVAGSGGVDMSGGGFSGDDGQATSALLKYPFDVKVDNASRYMYIADCDNARIRQINLQTGIISTVVGGGSQGFGGDGQAATSVETMLNHPYALSLDSESNIYIADGQNHRIRVVKNGVIYTIAGSSNSGYNGDEIQATSATLNAPSDLIVDSSGSEYLYIADYSNNRVRKVNLTSGVIITVAGDGGTTFSSDEDGVDATSTSIWGPRGLTLDDVGNIYIAEREHSRIRKVNITTGLISTIAGGASRGFSGDGDLAVSATLNLPCNVAVDSSYNVYFSDAENHRIRKIVSSTGIITTIAGTGSNGFSGDGDYATSASLYFPSGMYLNASSNDLYIADVANHRIRLLSYQGSMPTRQPTASPTVAPTSSPSNRAIISTVAGTGESGYSGDNSDSTSAAISNPHGIAVDSVGNVYFADSGNYRVRKITVSTGIISTYVGTGISGSYSGDGDVATSAAVNWPCGLFLDSAGINT